MKESQLVAKMKEVEGKLKDSQIVEKCYKVAILHGQGTTERRSHDEPCYRYKLENDVIKINLNDGSSDYSGCIKVQLSKDGKTVLNGERMGGSPEDERIKYKHFPEIEGFTILTYLPGKWEQKVEDLLAKPKEPPKPELPKDPEIDPIMLKKLQDNFSL